MFRICGGNDIIVKQFNVHRSAAEVYYSKVNQFYLFCTLSQQKVILTINIMQAPVFLPLSHIRLLNKITKTKR